MELRGQGRWDQEGIEAVQNDPQKIGSTIRVVDHLLPRPQMSKGENPHIDSVTKFLSQFILDPYITVYVFLKSIQL